MLQKTIRIIGVIVVMLVLAVLCIILIFDPPPFRLWDEDNFVLSIKRPPTFDRKYAGSIENGLACKVILYAHASDHHGRPVITFFDWLKHLSEAPREPDYQIQGTKSDDAMAIKIDRATNKFCWLTAGQAERGIMDAYCGPSIIREDATRIEALQGDKYGEVDAVVFNKTTYTATIISLDWGTALVTITYLECH